MELTEEIIYFGVHCIANLLEMKYSGCSVQVVQKSRYKQEICYKMRIFIPK